ncbi:MAG TPA: 50S ribosomal protein L7ae [Nanoarchaeota archaeon]|nr:ribosomal L7Ae/L30e/S12e/Gadd45 family protein [Candidatus Pacearchaeota archaeon]HIH17302.1 50S ribosomal protein L7ae [Nanoarchaeota archaeon]HIH34434.1 50S ribosomal protein L7ae [Nanoarchaeota archaeon]HIH51607.1 50S ribosomal protein L7ae [Nanoarchaeota archaeon]HIH65589.1 50S ribosomal protein L7ae [Nanoarchaeota archaeon]
MSYEIVEKARKTGKIKKGTNEVTKAIEREEAKLVVVAKDVSPHEIVQHLAALCKEKGIPCVIVEEKARLGQAAGVSVPTASIAIVKEGDAKADIEKLAREQK